MTKERCGKMVNEGEREIEQKLRNSGASNESAHECGQ